MTKENTNVLTQTVIKLNTLRWALVTVVFTALSVALPWIAHQFHLAGPTFLPMHFFVYVAALLAGWRVGLAVGITTPLVSYAVSGMPLLAVLPQITVEIAIYGLLAGLLRETFKMNIWVSLIAAMIGGRIALGIAVLIVGAKVGAVSTVVSSVTVGWIGILIQLAFIVILVKWLYKYLEKDTK